MSNPVITDQELSFWKKKFLVYAKFWSWNPVAFIYMLGIANLLPYQANILQSIVDNKRTIIRSGHGAGKTFIMALAACWWLCFHWIKGEGCSVIVTSPSASNLTTVFWAQFSKCMDLLPEYLKNQFTITAESCYENEDSFGWRLDLRTARKDNPDAMQGQHNVLFLIDEWSGVPKEIYDVVEGSMSDEGSRILAIGNALRRSGWGYDAFHKNSKLWNCIHINCELYTSDKFFDTIWTDILGVEHSDENQGRVDPKEVQKWLDISGGSRDARDYKVRVRGDFPDAGKDQYISLKIVNHCLKTSFYEEQSKAHTLGLDPATSGGDDIALLHRWGKNLMSVKVWQEEDTTKIAEQVAEWIETEGAVYKFQFIAVDAIGDGKGVYDYLRKLKDQGRLKNLEFVLQYKSSNEANNKERFDRKRDESWNNMKMWLIKEKPHFNKDIDARILDTLKDELTCLTSDFTTRGALKIESKKDLRKRGIKSPNIADALAMSFASSDDIAEDQKLCPYKQAMKDFMRNRTVNWRAV